MMIRQSDVGEKKHKTRRDWIGRAQFFESEAMRQKFADLRAVVKHNPGWPRIS
jgi:hypothetical protein